MQMDINNLNLLLDQVNDAHLKRILKKFLKGDFDSDRFKFAM
jgi:hypothetical protein